MNTTTTLESRYRRLLLTYPASYRAERGDEIVATLMETSPEGRHRPPWREVRSLLIGGFRTRAFLQCGNKMSGSWLQGVRLASLYVLGTSACFASFWTSFNPSAMGNSNRFVYSMVAVLSILGFGAMLRDRIWLAIVAIAPVGVIFAILPRVTTIGAVLAPAHTGMYSTLVAIGLLVILAAKRSEQRHIHSWWWLLLPFVFAVLPAVTAEPLPRDIGGPITTILLLGALCVGFIDPRPAIAAAIVLTKLTVEFAAGAFGVAQYVPLHNAAPLLEILAVYVALAGLALLEARVASKRFARLA